VAAPDVDNRSYGELVETAKQLAVLYTPGWSGAAAPDDAGAALLGLFARLMELLIARQNRMPDKNFLAFLDMVGIEALPGGAAEVPVTFLLPESAGAGWEVPRGSQVATTQTETADAQVFETRQTVFATPARVARVLNVVPAADGYSELPLDDLPPSAETLAGSGGLTLFAADSTELDPLGHVLYLASAELFGRSEPVDVTLTLTLAGGDAAVFAGTLVRWRRFDTESGQWQDLTCTCETAAGNAVRVKLEGLCNAGAVDVGADEDHWIAAVFEGDAAGLSNPPRISAIQGVISTPGNAALGTIDAAYTNAATLDVSKPFRPFGDRPRYADAFYLAGADAISPAVASLTLTFEILPYTDADLQAIFASIQAPTAIQTRIVWQYLAADGVWGELASYEHTIRASRDTSGTLTVAHEPGAVAIGAGAIDAGTLALLTGDGTASVQFRLALDGLDPDLGRGTVNQVEGYWIRALLLSEDPYGRDGFVTADASTAGQFVYVGPSFVPPRVNAMEVRYAHRPTAVTIRKVRTFNNLELVDASAALSDAMGLTPFVPIAAGAFGSEPAVCLGLDRDPGVGCLSTLMHLGGETSGAQFNLETGSPQVAWEYLAAGGGWKPLDASDGTDHLTSSGTVGFAWPADAATAALFPALFADGQGTEYRWCRARLVSGSYDHPPELRGAYLNTVMADNRVAVATAASSQAVTTESGGAVSLLPVGSGNGEPRQTVRLVKSPVLAGELWVFEPERPIEEELIALAAEHAEFGQAGAAPDPAELVAAAAAEDGQDSTGSWVRWLRMPHFLLSGAQSRHYTLNAVEGVLAFGDGTKGAIPPAGKDNLAVSGLRYGGGQAANAAAAVLAVKEMKTSLPFVDKVFNVQAAIGGADPWSRSDIMRFGPQSLKNRGRAVTTEDYEWMVLQAFSEVARARCLATRAPGAEGQLVFAPGEITMIIVPTSGATLPQPSKGLLKRIRDHLREHVLANIPPGIHAIGPSYEPVRIQATVKAERPEETSLVARRVVAALESFFHPLTGGEDGGGWGFGRAVPLSEVYATIDRAGGVDHVASAVFPDAPAGATSVAVDENSLVASGEHVITVI